MTCEHNTSTTSHSRAGCPGRLAESFWCLTECTRCGARLDATEIFWDGVTRYASATYHCACCGHRFSEDDWPLLLALGPGWEHREPEPVHLVAGIDSPRRAAAQVEMDLWRAAAT
jgi:hypothetical protein